GLTASVASAETTANSALAAAEGVEAELESLEGDVGAISGNFTSLHGAVEALDGVVHDHCEALNAVVNHSNTLDGGVSELTAALNLVLGGFTPKLPENVSGLTC